MLHIVQEPLAIDVWGGVWVVSHLLCVKWLLFDLWQTSWVRTMSQHRDILAISNGLSKNHHVYLY